MKWVAIIILSIVLVTQQYQLMQIKKTQTAIVNALGATTKLIEILMYRTRYQQ